MIERKLTGAPPRLSAPKGMIDTQMHLYLPEFPPHPERLPMPEGVPGPYEYFQVMNWVGIERFVVTQGMTYQNDNTCLVEILRRLGPMARGIASIPTDASEADMQYLCDAGVVGTRINELPGGGVGLSGLAAVDERAHDNGWCVAVQFDGSDILDHEAKLQALRSRYIIDHHGKFFCGVTPNDPRVDAVKRLIDRGNCWFKFAACYESSKSGPPDYADVGAVAKEIAAHAPDRIIWGTNWPHNMAKTTEDYPDDAGMLDLLLDWIPNDEDRYKALVSNPEDLFGF